MARPRERALTPFAAARENTMSNFTITVETLRSLDVPVAAGAGACSQRSVRVTGAEGGC